MTAASSPLRPELKQLRSNVEGVIQEMGVNVEWADDLPTRVRNIIASFQAEISSCQDLLGQHMTKRREAEDRVRALVAEMDAQVGAEYRANRAIQLAADGIIAPSEVRGWGDIGGPDAEPSSA